MQLPAYFVQILDLVDSLHGNKGKRWTVVGNISSSSQRNASQFSEKMLGHDFVDKTTSSSRQRFRVVTSRSPPFVQESTRMVNGTCLTGVKCLRVCENLPSGIGCPAHVQYESTCLTLLPLLPG